MDGFNFLLEECDLSNILKYFQHIVSVTYVFLYGENMLCFSQYTWFIDLILCEDVPKELMYLPFYTLH